MFPLFRRHTPSAATLLLILLLTGTPTPINGLHCYKCDGDYDCSEAFWKLNYPNESDYTILIETCSSPKEQCQLYFTTKVNRSTLNVNQAGCATPPKNHPKLDDAGCYSTPSSASASGTRTCYCKWDDKCNTNSLSCYNCQKEAHCTDYVRDRIGSFQALECEIQWVKAWPDAQFQDTIDFHHIEGQERPPNCNSILDHEWDIYERCTCQTSLCNAIPKGLKKYLAKKIPECEKCKVNNTQYCPHDNYRCRPGTVCSSHYIRNEEGVFTLNELGCEPPPTVDEEVIRIGWDPPNLSSADRKRSFYCDTGTNCNNPVLQCRTCKGKDDCSGKKWIPLKTCVDGLSQWTWRYSLPGRTKECFVRYDVTVTPPELEAGCRDFTLDKGLAKVDPICSLDLQKGWLRSGKGSCRCEIPECNPVLVDLAARIPEEPDPEEPDPEKEEPDPEKEESVPEQEEEKDPDKKDYVNEEDNDDDKDKGPKSKVKGNTGPGSGAEIAILKSIGIGTMFNGFMMIIGLFFGNWILNL